MEETKRLSARLDNIRAVEPILSALRTISLGARTVALKKAEGVTRFQQGLERVVALACASMGADSRLYFKPRSAQHSVQLLVVGTERGLCGTFNESLLSYVDQVWQELGTAGASINLGVLGSRAERALRSHGLTPVWSGRLSLTALPPPSLAHGLVSDWLQAYREGRIGRVEVAYNAYRGLAAYQPSRVQLLPLELSVTSGAASNLETIVETDRQRLLEHALRLWLSAKLYGILLDSAASEHTARYQLMDGAAENAQRLIEELTLFLQMARQEAITSEMRDLASGAGLLGSLPD